MGEKTLQQLCDAALEENGFDKPTEYVGNTDNTAMRVLRAAQRTGDELAQTPGKVWQELIKEHTFALVAADQEYALPDDFRYLLPSTSWDRTRRRQLLGINSQQWQALSAWTTSFGLNWRFRIRNNLFEIEQTIGSGDDGNTIAYEYVSKYWVCATGSSTATKSAFSLDTDTQVFDDELFILGIKWRFQKSLGFEYETDFAEYIRARDMRLARSGGITPILMSGQKGLALGVNVPEQDYG